MAVDTRDKRASVIGKDAIYARVYPNPDGDITSVADRQQIALQYSGIESGLLEEQDRNLLLIDVGF